MFITTIVNAIFGKDKVKDAIQKATSVETVPKCSAQNFMRMICETFSHMVLGYVISIFLLYFTLGKYCDFKILVAVSVCTAGMFTQRFVKGDKQKIVFKSFMQDTLTAIQLAAIINPVFLGWESLNCFSEFYTEIIRKYVNSL